MNVGIDYRTARDETSFTWSARGCQEAYRALTGVPIKEFNRDPAACIDCYRRGETLFRELFGPEVGLPPLTTPAISYGHANAFGCELIFPDGGEVSLEPAFDSIDEALRALDEPVDFAAVGEAPFYLEFRDALAEAFGQPCALAFGLEGPLTTGYELRGLDFFVELLDDPELATRFLAKLTDSIVDYAHFLCDVHGRPRVNPSGGGMCDDLASFVPPPLFDELVLPFWDRFYRGTTSGMRSIHVEDLRPEHLPYLEKVGIGRYDPSISAKLDPPTIRDRCRVPFVWRLGCFRYAGLSLQEVKDFVCQAAADGAGGVFTVVAAPIANEAGAEKVAAFVETAKAVQAHLAAGGPRQELAEWVSEAGRPRFWGTWNRPLAVAG